MIRGAGAVLAAVVAVGAAPAEAAVTIGAQIVDTRLSGTIAGVPRTSEGSDAATRAGTIVAAAQLVEAGSNGPAAVRGSSSVTAVLNSAERGRVTFRRTLTPGDANAILSSSARYVYRFDADAATAFNVNWGVAGYGTATNGGSPAQTLSLAMSGTTGALLRLDTLGNGASGETQVLLAPGSYELRIEDSFAPVAVAGVRSGLSSQYSFTMQAVPEPATWMLMVAGFGLAGVSRRRALRRSRSVVSPFDI